LKDQTAFFKILHYVRVFLASIIILFALLFSLLRGLLANIESFDEEISRYFKDEFQIDIHFGPVDSKWRQYGLNLKLNNFIIPQQDHLTFDLLIEHADIRINVWESLLSQSLSINHINLEDIYINVNKFTSSSDMEVSSDLFQFFFEQIDKIEMKNLRLSFHSQSKRSPPLQLEKFRWINQGNEHLAFGSVYRSHLNNQKKETFELIAKLKHDENQFSTLEGEVYTFAQNLNLKDWSNYLEENQLKLQTDLNFKFWGQIKNAQLHTGLFKFMPSSINWHSTKHKQKLEINSGTLQWFPEQDNWRLSSHDFHILSNGRVWQNFDLAMLYNKDYTRLYLEEVQLSNLVPLSIFFPQITASTADDIIESNIEGLIKDLRWQSSAQFPAQHKLALSNFSWNNKKQASKITPMRFYVYGIDHLTAIYTPSQSFSLTAPTYFSDTLNIRVNENWMYYQPHEQERNIYIPSMQLQANNLRATLTSRLIWSKKEPLFLSLNARTDIKDVSRISTLLPQKSINKNLYSYLSDAFVQGDIREGHILWYGHLNQYPYAQNQGIFQTQFTLDEAKFKFQPDWPNIDNLRLNALFQDQTMHLRIEQGKILNNDIAQAYIGIPKLDSEPILLVDISSRTDGQDLTKLMKKSPLKNSVGKTLDVIQISAPLHAKVNLQIPLFNSELIQSNTQGVITLKDNPIYISKPGIQFDKAEGKVIFNNDTITSENLKFRIYDEVVHLQAQTHADQDEDLYVVKLNMHGKWPLDALNIPQGKALKPFYAGDLNWQGQLSLLLHNKGHNLDIELKSDLENVALKFPSPLYKPPHQQEEFAVRITGDEKKSLIYAHLGERMECNAEVTHDQDTSKTYYNLILGRLFNQNDPQAKEQGHLVFDFKRTQLDPWMKVIKALGSSYQNIKPRLKASGQDVALRSIHGQIEQLDAFDSEAKHIKVEGHKSDQGWIVDVDSDRLQGLFTFYPDWRKQGLKLVANYLQLDINNAPQNDKQIKKIKRKSRDLMDDLPPLAVNLAELRINKETMKNVVFQGAPIKNGYHIQTFAINDDTNTMRLSALWTKENKQEQTNINFLIESKKLEDLMKKVNLNQKSIKAEDLIAQGEVSWNGTPFTTQWQEATGKINFSMNRGVLSNIDDKNARFISALSLNSLVRKLTLDFSDYFEEGFHFDSFTGDLVLNKGVLSTKNTFIDGLTAGIEVKGSSNLPTEELDLNIRITPKLASSVPAVLFFAGTPVAGLLAFAASKAIEPVIDVISEIKYDVTGTIDDPILTEVSRDETSIEVPKDVVDRSEQNRK